VIKDNDIPNWVTMALELGYGLPSAILIGKYFFKLDRKATSFSKLHHLYEELFKLKHTISGFISPYSDVDTQEKIAELETWKTKKYSSYFSMDIFKLIEILRSNPDLTKLSYKDQNMIDEFLNKIQTRLNLVTAAVHEL